MKGSLNLILLITLIISCKARKVFKEQKDSTSVKFTEAVSKQASFHLDTGKRNSSSTSTSKKITTTTDSSKTTITIFPQPGISISIAPDGTFHGPASKITHEYQAKSNKQEILDSQLQQTAGEINGVSDFATNDISLATKDSVNLNLATKKVDATPKQGVWPWVAGLVVLIGLCIALWWFIGAPKNK